MKLNLLRRLTLGSLLACPLALPATALAEEDFTSLPPALAETEDQIRSAGIDITQAVAAARQAVGGVVRSATLLLEEDASIYEVIAYSGGKGYRLRIDATSGEVLEREQFGRLPGQFSDTEIQETDSGLRYQVIQPGQGESPPDANATVKLDFEVYLVDGQKLWSTTDAGEPAEVQIQTMFEGMIEGVMGMQEGGVRKLIIPASLAFGEQGTPQIPPKATIIMDVSLHDVINYQELPETLPGEAVEGEPQVTDSGLMYYVLEEGEGPMPESDQTSVKVHYTGYLVTGRKFDSSVERGTPATFQLNGVIQGWTEGVGGMRVGERRKLIIPYEMAYGEQGRPGSIPPRATLIFDVELLGIVEKEQPQNGETGEGGGATGHEGHDHD